MQLKGICISKVLGYRSTRPGKVNGKQLIHMNAYREKALPFTVFSLTIRHKLWPDIRHLVAINWNEQDGRG